MWKLGARESAYLRKMSKLKSVALTVSELLAFNAQKLRE